MVSFKSIYQNQFVRFSQSGLTKKWEEIPEWTKGRSEYYGFVIRVNNPQILSSLSMLKQTLSQFSYISFHPDRFLHITLKALGFADPQKIYSDSLNKNDITRFIQQAESVSRSFRSFTINLRGINSFSNSLFVEIDDPGNNLINLISSLDGIQFDLEHRRLPHLTIGYYLQEQNNKKLVRALSELRESLLGNILIDSFELITTNSQRELYPELKQIRRFSLR